MTWSALLHDDNVAHVITGCLGIVGSNAGHNAHYGWLYDTFQSSLMTLQLAVVRFIPVPMGLYMSRAVSRRLLIEFEPSRSLSSPPTRMLWCSRAWGAQDHDATQPG